ncbi:MAG: glycosyltransferase [Rikenellaceae bacterium]
MEKRLSLIVATYNRADKVLITLRSIIEQQADPSLWEAIIVNNNSTDSTAEVVSKFISENPRFDIRLVREHRQGLSYARNCGIESSVAPLIAIIDDDEEVVPTYISSYIQFFDTHPEVASAGGAVIARYESRCPKWMSHLVEIPIVNPISERATAAPFPKGKIPGGGNMAIRRIAIEKYGAFDPELGRRGDQLLGGEESNLFDRLRRGGEQVWFVPEAAIYHIIPDSKLTLEYQRKLWFNIGVSQLRRGRIEGVSPLVILLREALKWGVTLALALLYTLMLSPQKAYYLMAMRRNISSGIISALKKIH